MPDTLVNLTSPAEPSRKERCRKKAPTPGVPAGPSAAIAALASAEAARVLPSAIFHEADAIEVGTRRARTSLDLAWDVVNELDAIGEASAKPTGISLGALSSRLYLLLGIVSDELKSAHSRADKITDLARELKNPMPAQPLGTGDDLLALRLQLKAAEDALNASDNDESPLLDAYHEANDRFLDAPTRTPSDILLKLERLADLGDMASDPQTATNRIVLNLIRDLRGALGINGQVQ